MPTILETILEAQADAELGVEEALEELNNKYMEMYSINTETECLSRYFTEWGKTNRKKDIDELSVFKFNNDKIREAINLFNEGRSKIASESKSNQQWTQADMTNFAKSSYFKQGVKCLENQFDCKIIISRFMGQYIFGGSATIPSINIIKKTLRMAKVTVSKSKGFQLHGLRIFMTLGNEAMLGPSDASLFGQYIASILLHEIFHNISYVLSINTFKLFNLVKLSSEMGASTNNVDNKIKISEGLINSISAECDNAISISDKKTLIKKMATVYSAGSNLNVVNKAIDKAELKRSKEPDAVNGSNEEPTRTKVDGRDYINALKKRKKSARVTGILREITPLISAGLQNLYSIIKYRTIGIFDIVFPIVSWLWDHRRHFMKKDLDEFYSDLFASMYQLPPTFKHIYRDNNKKIQIFSSNSVQSELINELHDELTDFHKQIIDVHPSESTRNWSAVQTAKQMLSQENISQETRKYLEWIIANYSKLDDANVGDTGNKRLFNAAQSKDLNMHLKALVDSNQRIQITEYDASWIFDNNDDIIYD